MERLLFPTCPWVFHNDGRQIRNHYGAWKTARKAAGVPNRTMHDFHDFRRTAVRNLVRAGVLETVAMSITGHKTRHVLGRYNITSVGDLEEAAAKIDRAARTPPGKGDNDPVTH